MASVSDKVETMGHSKLLLLSGIAAVGLFMLAFYPVWKHLGSVWYSSEEYSHGFLILPVALFTAWRQRASLARLEPRPSALGLPLVLLFLALYIFSLAAGVQTIAALSMLILLGATVLYLLGWPALRRLAFPLLFLLFMVPVPAQVYSTLTIPLQLLVSRASVWLSVIAGVPLVQEGNLIHLPNRTLQVVEACSGLRSMMTLLALGALIWHLTLKSKVLGLVLLFSALPVALLSNILRVTLVVIPLWHLNADLSSGAPHTILGLAINALSLLLIFSVRGVLSRWEPAWSKG